MNGFYAKEESPVSLSYPGLEFSFCTGTLGVGLRIGVGMRNADGLVLLE